MRAFRAIKLRGLHARSQALVAQAQQRLAQGGTSKVVLQVVESYINLIQSESLAASLEVNTVSKTVRLELKQPCP